MTRADKAPARAAAPSYVLRLRTDQDNGPIYSAWLKGAYECSPNNYIPRAVFIPRQCRTIAHYLANATTYVAVHPDDPDELFGFICFEFIAGVLTVHWIYIKNMWRRMGLARHIVDTVYPDRCNRPIVATQYSKHYAQLRNHVRLTYVPPESFL